MYQLANDNFQELRVELLNGKQRLADVNNKLLEMILITNISNNMSKLSFKLKLFKQRALRDMNKRNRKHHNQGVVIVMSQEP